jgi:hypothetical protein
MPTLYGRKLACSTDHPGVVKFNVVHAKIIEAYQLWWNGHWRLTLGDVEMSQQPKLVPQ